MNHRKIDAEKRNDLNILFKYGIPIRVLELVFEASCSTIYNHLSLEEKKLSDEFQEIPAEKKLFLFKLYAWIIADEADCTISIGSNLTSKLSDGIYEYLKLKDWENILDGMKILANSFRENRFHESVTESYRKLINELFPTNKERGSSKVLLKEMLTKMHREELSFPESNDIGRPSQALSKIPLDLFNQEGFVRYFDHNFVSFLNFHMKDLDKKQELYVKAYFGISDTNIALLSQKLGNTESTVNGIKSKALKLLRRRLEKITQNNLSFSVLQSHANLANQRELSKSQKDLNRIKEKAEKEIFLLKKNLFYVAEELSGNLNLSPKAEEIISAYRNPADSQRVLNIDPEVDAILDKKIEDLDISTRLFNCLKLEAKIETVRRLVKYRTEDLMRIRNFGKKCLAEIEILFEKDFQNKVYLGMDFL